MIDRKAFEFYAGAFILISAILFHVEVIKDLSNSFTPLFTAFVAVMTLLGVSQLGNLKPHIDKFQFWIRRSRGRRSAFRVIVLSSLTVVIFCISCIIYKLIYEQQIEKLLDNTKNANNISSPIESNRIKSLINWYWGRPEITNILQMRKALLRDPGNQNSFREHFKTLLANIVAAEPDKPENVLKKIKNLPKSIKWRIFFSSILSKNISNTDEEKLLLFLIRTYGEVYASTRKNKIFHDILSITEHYDNHSLIALYQKVVELGYSLSLLKEKSEIEKVIEKMRKLDTLLKKQHGNSLIVTSDEYQQALDYMAMAKLDICSVKLNECDRKKLEGQLSTIYEKLLEARSQGKLWEQAFLFNKDKYLLFWIIWDKNSDSTEKIYPGHVQDNLEKWKNCCNETLNLVINRLSSQYELAMPSSYRKKWKSNTISEHKNSTKNQLFDSGFLINKGWRY